MATGQMYGVLVHDLQNSSLSPKSAARARSLARGARAQLLYGILQSHQIYLILARARACVPRSPIYYGGAPRACAHIGVRHRNIACNTGHLYGSPQQHRHCRPEGSSAASGNLQHTAAFRGFVTGCRHWSANKQPRRRRPPAATHRNCHAARALHDRPWRSRHSALPQE
jgi:hypothetical protein